MEPLGFTTLFSFTFGICRSPIIRTCALRKAPEAHIRRRVINAFEPVAQSVEHVTFNHGVQGSNPCGLTINHRKVN